jgi:hypothetical protein
MRAYAVELIYANHDSNPVVFVELANNQTEAVEKIKQYMSSHNFLHFAHYHSGNPPHRNPQKVGQADSQTGNLHRPDRHRRGTTRLSQGRQGNQASLQTGMEE